MSPPITPGPLPSPAVAADAFPPGTTVLVVDDEPVVRMLARVALSRVGVVVTEAEDAAGAMAALRVAVRPFDLVLLDLSLPGFGGAELIPEFRTRSPWARILLVSGHIEEEAADLGADGFLGKPFTRATLVEAVRKTLAAPPQRPRWEVDDHTPSPDDLR